MLSQMAPPAFLAPRLREGAADKFTDPRRGFKKTLHRPNERSIESGERANRTIEPEKATTGI